MYILVKNIFFHNIMRQFFFNLDKIVFGLISKLYDLLLLIARTSPLSQGDIANMSDRIYRLLALFMLFKVTFSLIMYVVNPDDFTEKGKGATSLLKNIVLSLAILVLTPFIFRYAYQFQEMVLESNAMAALVFGDENSKKGFFNSAGESMAYTAISPFFVPDTSIDSLNNCSVLMDGDKFNSACSGLDKNTYEPTGELDTLYGLTQNNASDLTETDLKNYVAGVENSSMGLTFRANMALAITSDDRYIMDYSYFVSTAVGVIIALLLVSFCMDIGVRSIKLAFLQLIAPIPIISYIDPKSGKDGLFKKWYKMCLSTFASLFVRLIVIYFAVYIISKVANHKLVDVIDGSYVTNAWVSLFILIGALMFAKQFPKILENLGIKLDGGGKFTLNPIKKMEEQALGGKRITGAAGALVSGAADRGTRVFTAPGAKGKIAALAGAGPGLLGATARGFSSNQGYKGGKSAQNAVNRQLREGRIKGLSPVSSYLDYFGSRYGLDDATLEREGTILQEYERQADQLEAAREAEAFEYRQTIKGEQDAQKTMKSAQTARSNIKSKGDAMLNISKDLLQKKADFGGSKYSDALGIVNSVRDKSMRITDLSREQQKKLVEAGITKPEDVFNRTKYDTLVAASSNERKLNFKSTNNANNSNLSTLQTMIANNKDGIADRDLIFYTMDGSNYVVRAGQKIDGSVYAKAQETVGNYEKDAINSITDALNKDANYIPEDIKNSEGRAFKRRKKEFEDEITEANKIGKDFNSEYSQRIAEQHLTDLTDIEQPPTDPNQSFAKYVKKINDDMENDNNADVINSLLGHSNSAIDAANRKIAEIESDEKYFINYTDENGKNHFESTSKYREHVKPRAERHKKNVERHQQRRSLFKNSKS